jgi:pimeloyl-ACP methyl ester carboxylesterase
MLPSPTEFFTPSGVRARRRVPRAGNEGHLNWLLLPGGPGIGAESLNELADILDVPGTVWMVDLPGDGSNIAPATSSDGFDPNEPFAKWPQVLVEAAQALPNCVHVGHSTGGMYLLSVPELEKHIVGLALISTAPDTGWRLPFFEMTKNHPLPAVDEATRHFEAEPTNDNLRAIAVASAEWNFPPQSVAAGREFLGRMPYNQAAVAWSDSHFDDVYQARWWPDSIPTLILSGAEDRIVLQTLWDSWLPASQSQNVLHRTVPNAGHFPWFEEPSKVRSAFQELAANVLSAQ